jgi:FdhD protein
MTLAEHPAGCPAISAAEVLSWREGEETRLRIDHLAVEEPLEIRLAGCSVAVTMRTPGDDFDLATGFLFTEGIIRHPDDVTAIAHCPTDDVESALNVVNVNPRDPSLVDPERWRRNFFATSSCGICGKASIAAIRQDAAPIEVDVRISSTMLLRMAETLRAEQDVFSRTGGLHAAALFTLSGELVTLREDIGRHNAVDKMIGDRVRRGAVPLSDHALVVSSRASFEVMQKALMAGIPIVAAVSAPSSLAVELAREANMTLVGFLRPGRFNVYAGEERVVGYE